MSGKTPETCSTKYTTTTVADGVGSCRKARQCSSAEALLEVVELGGGCAVDLAEALLESEVSHDRALLAAALRATKRRQEDEQAPDMRQALKQRGPARNRSKHLMEVVKCAGGSELAVLATLLRLGPAASDLVLLGGSGASSDEAPSGERAPEANAVPIAVAEPAQAAMGGAGGGATGGTCRVCCSKPRGVSATKACAGCDSLVRRLRKQSAGACKRGHVRAAFAELGGNAPVRAVEQLARQLAGGEHAEHATAAPGSDGVAAAAEAAEDTSGGTGDNTAGAERAGSSGGSTRPSSSGGEAVWLVTPPPRKKAKLFGGGPGGSPSAAASLGGTRPEDSGQAQQTVGAPARSPAAAAAPRALAMAPARPVNTVLFPAAEAPPGRPCPICRGRNCVGKKSYCNPCLSMVCAFRGKGKVQLMREAFRELGSHAARADVLAHVRHKLAASEETVSTGEAI